MKMFFGQLYGNIDDLCNSRILDELEYYMYEVRNKKEMIYFSTVEQTILLIVQDDSEWTIEKLQVLFRTSLRENSFILIPLREYTGYMNQNVWKNVKENPEEFFKDPQTFRKNAGRGSKLTKLLSTIKRAITPKPSK